MPKKKKKKMQSMMGIDDNKKIGMFLLFAGVLFLWLGIMLLLTERCWRWATFSSWLALPFSAACRGRSNFLPMFKGCALQCPFSEAFAWSWLDDHRHDRGDFRFLQPFQELLSVVLVWLRHVPFVGQILNMPGIATVLNKIAGLSKDDRNRRADEGSLGLMVKDDVI